MRPIVDGFKRVVHFAAWLLAMFLFASGGVQAQTAYSTAYTYSFINVPPSWETPSGSATTIAAWDGACTSYPIGDDDKVVISFPSGFVFNFGGTATTLPTAYTNVRINSNGSVQFGATDQGVHRIFTPTALPAARPANWSGACPGSNPTNVLYAYWRDLTASPFVSTPASGPVRYELLGTAPNRRFVVTWDNVRQYGTSANNFSFQVALYEGPSGINGEFEYRYISGVTDGRGASIGVQVSGTDWFQYNPSTNTSAATAPIDPLKGTTIRWQAITVPPTPKAVYKFNEPSYNGTAGEVVDLSGLNNHAFAQGGITTAAYTRSGAGCTPSERAVSFPAQTSATSVAGIASPVTVGYTGSVSFFYRSTQAWATAATMLFDASSTGAPFFFMKSATGQLVLKAAPNAASNIITATTAAQTVAANTWKNIAVSWVFLPGTNQTYVQIFLDGVLILNQRFTVTTLSGVGFPTLGTFDSTRTIFIGDANSSAGPSGGTNNSANGLMDDLYIYSSQVNSFVVAANISCTPLFDHVEISASPSSTNPCTPVNLSIRACQNASCTLTYNNGMATTLAATGVPAPTVLWGSNGTNLLTDGTGAASTSLQVTSAGTNTTISATATSPTPANAAAVCTFGNNPPANNNCVLAISSSLGACVADFSCTESTANAAIAADSAANTGRIYTKLAGTAFSFDVVARKSDGTQATLYASDSDKVVTVELVDGAGVGLCPSRAALSPAVTSQSITFQKVQSATDQGRRSASFTVPNAYPNVRCRATDNATTPTKGCSIDNFVIRPPAVTLNTSANAVGPSVSATPAVKAGAAFALYATSTASPNYTGSLARDGSVALSAVGGATPSAALGTLTLTPATIATNPATVPSGNATYTEVGYLNLPTGAYSDTTFAAVDNAPGDCIVGSFLDTLPALPAAQKYGCSITHAAASLGRFIPDHFDTVIVAGTAPTTPIACPTGPPALTCPSNAAPSANGFVYANQPFTVQTTARNAICAPACGTTQNYGGTFAKTTALSAWNAKGADPAVAANANPGGGTVAGVAPVFANGVASVTDSRYGTTLPALLAPADVYFRAAEASGGDGVTSRQTTPANSVEAGLKIASGRIKIPNAYGSEKLLLPMVFTVQYFNGGTAWLTSTTDSTMSFNSAVVASGGNLTVGVVQGAAGCVTVNSPATASVASGLRTVSLAASSAPCSANISLSGTPSYLPIYPPVTGGRATFGIFKSPLIYRRENY